MKTLRTLNYFCFVLGMIGVWQTTHNGWALFWTFIASLHFTILVKSKAQKMKEANYG